jgi:hypothetical protein
MKYFEHEWYDIWRGSLLMLFVADYCLFADSPVLSRLTYLAWIVLGIFGFVIHIIVAAVRSVRQR